jgi:tripartite-type tricarboxylate transporter receptor subunit TctC
MQSRTLNRARRIAWLAGLTASAIAIGADNYPNRPIRMLVPFAAGGAIDLMARPTARKMHDILGQPVVVENRPGAGGSIAAEATAKSASDGYTIFFGSTSPLAINPAYFAKVGYDTLRDFTPISLAVKQPLIIVAHPSLPVRNLADVVAMAKRQPGKLSYGSAGPGTSNHLVGELLNDAARIEIVHVPYKGGAPALTALLGGEIELQVSQPNTMMPFIKSGRVRAIATTGARRLAQLPQVGTLVEAGYKDLDIIGWYCIVGPANLPTAVVDKLNASIRQAIASPEVRDMLIEAGSEPVTSTPGELFELMKSDMGRWARAAKIAKGREAKAR